MATAWRSVITRRRAGGDPARPSWIGSKAAATVVGSSSSYSSPCRSAPRRLKYWSSVARTEGNRLPGTRTLAATLFVSLDGVVESPEKWSFPFWSEETQKFKFDETFASDALLLGRVTYEGFAAAWPGRKDPDGFADRFNSMPKFVASRTLKKLAWNNSHLIKGDLAGEVSKLKEQPGRDIVIHGSPGLIRSLLPSGLIDEFRLLVYPLVLGHGKRLFDEGSQASLKLVESTTFSKGVVKLVYRPADKAGQAKQRETARPKRNTKRRKA